MPLEKLTNFFIHMLAKLKRARFMQRFVMLDEKTIIKIELIEHSNFEQKSRVLNAMQIAILYCEKEHENEKSWVIDQMFRQLSGKSYESIMKEIKKSGFHWSEGIHPE